MSLRKDHLNKKNDYPFHKQIKKDNKKKASRIRRRRIRAEDRKRLQGE